MADFDATIDTLNAKIATLQNEMVLAENDAIGLETRISGLNTALLRAETVGGDTGDIHAAKEAVRVAENTLRSNKTAQAALSKRIEATRELIAKAVEQRNEDHGQKLRIEVRELERRFFADADALIALSQELERRDNETRRFCNHRPIENNRKVGGVLKTSQNWTFSKVTTELEKIVLKTKSVQTTI